MTEEDADIMSEVAAGNLSSFRRIVERYQGSLISYIFRYTGDQASSEDIAQEVFLRVFKSAGEYRALSSFKTWLYTIATALSPHEPKSLDRMIHPDHLVIPW